jgi:surfactin synthase thioesterase subunit
MHLATAVQPAAAHWFPYGAPQPGAGLPVFCFPYAGGGASLYRSWRGSLGPDAQIVPVQLPGREHRHQEPAAVRLRPLVEQLADALAPHLPGPHAPYALFGHSMGATIAYELAAELAARGSAPPVVLFVSAACAPHLRRIRPDLHLLPEPEFAAQIRRLGGTPAGLLDDPDAARFHFARLRADLELVATYQRSADLPVPRISAFGGAADAAVEPAAVLAWRGYAAERFHSRILPGGHFFLQPQRAALLAALRADLAGADDNPKPPGTKEL